MSRGGFHGDQDSPQLCYTAQIRSLVLRLECKVGERPIELDASTEKSALKWYVHGSLTEPEKPPTPTWHYGLIRSVEVARDRTW